MINKIYARAWVKGKMYNVGGIFFGRSKVLCKKKKGKIDKLTLDGYIFHLEDCVIMLGTDIIKDKNGKVIYDNDIVVFEEYGVKAYGIAEIGVGYAGVKQLTFPIVHREEDGYKWQYRIELYSPEGQEFSWSDLEVIGNIYENEKLYEKLKEEERNYWNE